MKISTYKMVAILIASSLIAIPSNINSFAFVFASASNGVDLVTHPIGYIGAGGNLSISVGIDPTSANATDMVTPIKNAIIIINALNATTSNLKTGASTNVPSGSQDFESTVLHEMIHSMGLAHPNIGAVAGVSGNDRNYTNSTLGADGVYDFDDGVDNIIGSKDDSRDDDINLNWFRTSNNNPFTISGTIDNTTYSRDPADLPSGDAYSVNADRTVGIDLGFTDTECVMQQGTFNGESQRTLGHDDVAGLKFGMSGIDETESTLDDYTFTLTYVGMTTSADIVVDFDDAQTGFAVSSSGGGFVAPNHAVITSNNIYFNNSAATWFFNPNLLPVQLITFTAETLDNDAVLKWATASEIDHSHFEVQRKTKYDEWRSISNIYSPLENDNGSRDYSFIDPDFGYYDEIVYYRLKIVALDGSMEYSDTKVLRANNTLVSDITLSHNPIQDHTTLQVGLPTGSDVSVKLYSLDGRLLNEKVFVGNMGLNEFGVYDLFQQYKGMYLLQVSFGTQQKTFRVIR